MNLTAIYNLDWQSFSIGDMLVFQQGALIEMHNRRLSGIDMIISYDTERPTHDPKLSYINPRNVKEHLAWLEPVAAYSEAVKSVSVHARTQFKLGQQIGEIWCPKTYAIYDCIGMVKRDSPRIVPKPSLARWADDFLDRHGRITVNIRQTKSNPTRNSNNSAWAQFFKTSRERFVVVCAQHEIDEQLRLPNVTFAKDHGSTSDLDCALVAQSDYHLGVSSGPTMAKWFEGGPLCEFKVDRKIMERFGAQFSGDRGRYAFANPWQHCVLASDTPERIAMELEKLKESSQVPA